MLGIEGYGSDSDNDSDNETSSSQSVIKPPTFKPSAPAKKSTFSLPPPSANASGSSSNLGLPPPKKKAPRKITIGLPELPKDDDVEDDRPPAKKPRLDSGAGRSGLLSMLPAPKNKVPVLPPRERVLGGGRGPGLVFHAASSSSRKATVEDATEDVDEEKAAPSQSYALPSGDAVLEDVKVEKSSSIAFLPPHLGKGRANVNTEDRPTAVRTAAPKVTAAPAIDFFGLGSSAPPSSKVSTVSPAPLATAPPAGSLLPQLSSAPEVKEFRPPEPTRQDSYPGYYQLPSGTWAAHDPVYYKSFYDKWTKEYNDQVRALEKGIEKGFEGLETQGAHEVDAGKVMEKAKVEIQDREEKKALTAGAGMEAAAPKMNIKGAALGGRAKTRHQLSTLLSEAYSNREELEERIAQGRRNRKEAGNKYGF